MKGGGAIGEGEEKAEEHSLCPGKAATRGGGGGPFGEVITATGLQIPKLVLSQHRSALVSFYTHVENCKWKFSFTKFIWESVGH